MLRKRVHGNVGAARQAAAGQAAAVRSNMQQTRERRASGYGMNYTAKKVSVFLNYLHSTANFKNVRSKCLNKQGTLSSDDQHGRPIRARTTLLYARD